MNILDTVVLAIDRIWVRHTRRYLIRKFFHCVCGSRRWHTLGRESIYWSCRDCGETFLLIASVSDKYATLLTLSDHNRYDHHQWN